MEMDTAERKSKRPRTSGFRDEVTSGSQIFRPYRALGLITDATPFALQHFNGETFATVSLGKSFQMYNCSKLNLLFVGPLHQRKIKAIVMYKKFTLTASGPNIYIWKRARLANTLTGHLTPVKILYMFADLLISVSQDSVLRIWDLSKCRLNPEIDSNSASWLVGEIKFPESFKVTTVTHPSTYLNKIVVGSEQGTFQLWNLKTQKLVYSFQGWGSAITCIEQSPAVDVVGLGLANGKVVLHNLKYDKTVMSFTQTEGKVTSLSFRTDGHQKLVTTTQTGRIVVWDLGEKKLQKIIKNAHNGEIGSARFFPNEPILMTAGDDNSVKIWIFDQADGGARVLRERSGHSAPPSYIRFYGFKDGFNIISAGGDRSLRIFSTIQQQRSFELSQGKLKSKAKKYKTKEENLKLSPIVQFDSSPVKEREWDNIVTCHETETGAHTWRYENKVLGRSYLRSKTPSPLKYVAISTCGNFALLGDAAGRIDKYNIQSGKSRGSFTGHTKAVTGIATDFLNKVLISTGIDGTIRSWDFKTCKLIHTIDLGTPITQMVLNRDSALLVTASDDLVIRVFDIEQNTMVRVFEGHTNAITDMAFSPDGRWLVTASADATVRVWDLPSAKLIDWFSVDKPVTSLTFSPTGDFLATSHVDDRGIFLWSNQNYFSKVFFRPVGERPAPMRLPSVLADPQEHKEGEGEEDEKAEEKGTNQMDEEMKQDAYAPPKEPLQEGILTLSDVPRQKWQTLNKLELIRERNKPLLPPEKPKAAPFFLPTTLEARPTFALTDQEGEKEAGDSSAKLPKSRILNMKSSIVRTPFVKMLEVKQYKEALDHLNSLSPSAVDAEFRLLHLDEDYYELKLVIKFLHFHLSSNANFDVVQAYLALFLKVHGDIFAQSDEMVEKVQELRQAQREGWVRLQSLLHGSMCLVAYFQGIQF